MATPFVGEIRLFAGTYAPVGWKFCDGAILSVNDYPQLADLLGDTYGGNGTTTFALPDMEGRVPVGVGQGMGLSSRSLGEQGGAEEVQLSTNEIPEHSHKLLATSDAATSGSPMGNVPATLSGDTKPYVDATPNIAFSAEAVATSGRNEPHQNLIPFLGINYIIALTGVNPT
ncbi:MAG: tail fiber protein [Chloroflexota bacterium]